MKFDVVIVGSGLGGLQCGYILSKHGMKVCVLEKNTQPGGCIQSFRRGKNTFDTGFHYVGGLDKGEPLYRLFSYFGLMDLPWLRMDADAFDEVVIGGKSYMFANGYERFAEKLSEQFPRQRKNLKKYADFLRDVSDNTFSSFKRKSIGDIYEASLFAESAYNYLTATFDDPLLRNVLSGTSMKLELNPQTLPLYIFAQINSTFIQSSWRLRGGGSLIADSLIKSIEANGGTVRMKAEVTRLVEEDGKIVAAEINGSSKSNFSGSAATSDNDELLFRQDGLNRVSSSSNNDAERIEADYFIANAHPAVALSLITESKLIRNIYRKRISNMENTFGFFTANIALKENAAPYLNRNVYVCKTDDLWQYADYKPENINTYVLASSKAPENDSQFTRNIDILTPMYWQEVEQWEHTTIGRRGKDYLSFKNQKAEACLNLVSEYVPGLKGVNPKDVIENIYTSTSLSYRDYTGTPHGSAYGLRKNYDQLLTTLLSPRTPEPNLFFTGQNLNLHGVLGVSMTSFFTCAEILGMDVAIEGLL